MVVSQSNESGKFSSLLHRSFYLKSLREFIVCVPSPSTILPKLALLNLFFAVQMATSTRKKNRLLMRFHFCFGTVIKENMLWLGELGQISYYGLLNVDCFVHCIDLVVH